MLEHPQRFTRRTALRSLAATAIAAPAVLGGPLTQVAAAATPLWHPNPATDGLKAFEGIEADRGHLHPDRKYIYAEGDHYRFNIWADDRDTTGGGDRQRTESKGMVQGGTTLKIAHRSLPAQQRSSHRRLAGLIVSGASAIQSTLFAPRRANREAERATT